MGWRDSGPCVDLATAVVRQAVMDMGEEEEDAREFLLQPGGIMHCGRCRTWGECGLSQAIGGGQARLACLGPRGPGSHTNLRVAIGPD